MKYKGLFLFVGLVTSVMVYAQKMTASDRIKMMTAQENVEKNNLEEAYKLYREVHRNIPNNAEVNFQCGKTAFALKRYNEADIYFTKALNINPKISKELKMWIGRTQHMLNQLTEAKASLEEFKATLKGKRQQTHIVNEYIYQVEMAQKLMANPVNVVIKNMGKEINSEYPESNPSITADGQTFIFTTARPDNVGGKIDPDFGIYFQDIWMSTKDPNTGKWTEAERLGGELNTPDHDANLSISSDGSVIFVYRSVKGGDIYYSKKNKKGEWRTPEVVGGKVNTTYFESGACMSADKKELYFISERVGKGKGNGDIWVAKKTGSFEYGEAENLSILNSIDDESSVFLHPNGKTLFFSSNCKESIGGYDIFKSDLVDGKWTAPVNLGYPINTLGDEMMFTISADGQTGYYTTKRDDSYGGYDIYEVDLSNYRIPNLDKPYAGSQSITIGDAVSILKGRVLDKKDGEPMEVTVRIETEAGKLIEELQTNENGEYFITLQGDSKYKISIKTKDYKPIEEVVFIPKSGTKSEIVIRSYLMEED
ncbi:MAG: hypothetical protein N2167_11440 [Flavobacteriales bacterium]|nr:hypothetical protein [Flavobacteriales bacterium]